MFSLTFRLDSRLARPVPIPKGTVDRYKVFSFPRLEWIQTGQTTLIDKDNHVSFLGNLPWEECELFSMFSYSFVTMTAA